MELIVTGSLIERFLAALLIGALVGLERQFAGLEQGGERVLFAGIRTFPILSLTGFAAALAGSFAPWAFIAAFLGISALTVTAYHFRAVHTPDSGTTTPITFLLVFLLGGLCYWNQLALAAASAVVVTLLLSYKPTLHRLVAVLEEEDVRAILKFALISVVVLPALPNRDLGPGGLFNPRLVWLMVVFISAVSFTGYGLTKIAGERFGLAATGVLGGFASSTAVAFSFAGRVREYPERTRAYGAGIALASTTLYPRMLLIAGVWSPSLVGPLLLPTGLLFAAGLLGSIWLWRAPAHSEEAPVPLSNPFRLGPALKFGALFALILIISRGSYELLGARGIYATGFLAGLEGLDAITLSVGRLVGIDIPHQVGVRALLLAVAANTAVKGAIVRVTGSAALFRQLFLFFLAQVLIALLFVAVWP